MKIKKKYICSNCKKESLGWQGKCSFCGSWGTIEEIEVSDVKSPTDKIVAKGKVEKLKNVNINECKLQEEELEEVKYFKIEELQYLDNEGFEWLENLRKVIEV